MSKFVRTIKIVETPGCFISKANISNSELNIKKKNSVIHFKNK